MTTEEKYEVICRWCYYYDRQGIRRTGTLFHVLIGGGFRFSAHVKDRGEFIDNAYNTAALLVFSTIDKRTYSDYDV